MVILSASPDPGDDEADIRWVRDYYAAVHPYSGTTGGYVNFMDSDDAARAPENYGGSYERLRAVKAEYDPNNLFHLNQNVTPAKGGSGEARPLAGPRLPQLRTVSPTRWNSFRSE
jgi:FAD/FMN-containing dehydrogenase